ncbi:cyclic nucleotide-binding domain-containing protein [Thalassospiraceae bacterium LMO-JJ14]|nr:cyclic nucleotide-binding domain-containing protein [Thalassospiraceae bacterium LMO-JJ14]
MATKEFKSGDILLAEGSVPETAYRILQGSVELSRDADGMSMPTAVLDRGSLIGAEELIDGRVMDDTVQALGALTAELVSKEQAAGLLGKQPAKKQSKPKRNLPALSEDKSASGEQSTSRALVALSASTAGEFHEEDAASSVLKPGLLRRILKPDFADVYDRLDVRISALEGDGGEQAAAYLISELSKRRGLRARAMNSKVMLEFETDPIGAMRELKRASERWLVDNGGDIIVWGAVANAGTLLHLRFFVREEALVDQFRMGGGWTLLILPLPLDAASAHRLHAALLATVRTKQAGKLLTVRRDLDVLLLDAREQLLQEVPHLDPIARAEERATVARTFASATRFKRRAEDAQTAMQLFDSSLEAFSADRTPLEWAFVHRDRAYLGQFIAERTNDTNALRDSIDDLDAALRVIGPDAFPYDWAAMNNRLGLALYRLDFDNGDADTLERALVAFENTLTIYDKKKTPSEWAEAMGHFGQVALVIGRENRNPAMLLQAVEACNAVVSARDRRHMPLHWASAQNNLGSALFLYGRIAGDTSALQGARDAFRTARAIYVEKGADRMAGIAEKNLRHVDKAMSRGREKSTPPELPWEGRGDEPPPLPWEFGPGASGGTSGVSGADVPASGPRSKTDTWLDERLR